MLRDVYLQVGLGWTVLIGGVVMLTALTWIVAMAGAVTRPMSPLRRGLLLAVLTVVPPSAIIVFMRFVSRTRAELRARATPGARLSLVGSGRRAA